MASTWKGVAIIFIILSLALGIALIIVTTKSSAQESKTPECGDGNDVEVAPITTSTGIFDDLSPTEIDKVYNYMLEVKSLKLKPNHGAEIHSNIVAFVQLYPPSKDQALAYLDEGKAKPERKSLVVVFRGGATPPVVEEYIVWPASSPSNHVLRKDQNRRYPINFNARPLNSHEEAALYTNTILPFFTKLERIFKESYDGYGVTNCADKCLYYQFAAPYGLTANTRGNWYILMRQEVAFYSHPLNFEFYIDHAGNEPSQWAVKKLLYNGQLFNSTEELIHAYDNNKLVKTFIRGPKGGEKLFSTYERRGKQQPTQPSRGPEQYEPGGKRYTVTGRHVEYMNWAFDFRVDSSTGPQVYDVRFGGERIVYEISLQEAIATYTGHYPTQTGIHFLDSSYMMGANAHDLLQGNYNNQ